PNLSETIPAPLRDRRELIRLDGYTEEEKVAIARDHLLKRQVRQAGLKPDEVTVDDAAIMKVITDHTREAGVRNLERELGKITRKIATKVAKGELAPPVAITPDRVREFLGKPRFDNEVAARTAVPGVATGLAVTGTGGDVLFVEATATDSNGHGSTLTLTGEVTLQRLVLPIGGVKEKVLAAHRMGLTEVILPKRNEKDIDDVPQSVRDAMTFHLASRVDDVLKHALEPASTVKSNIEAA